MDIKESKNTYYRWLFQILVLIYVFQIPLQTLFSPLRYFDEIYAVIVIPLLLLHAMQTDFQVKTSMRLIMIIVMLGLFCICGMVGNFRLGYQKTGTALADVFLNLKFYLGIATSYEIFRNSDVEDTLCSAWKLIRGIIIMLFVLSILDLVFHIFPGGSRYGLRTISLFYSLPTALAAVCIFLCALLLKYYEYYADAIFPYMCMLGFVTFWTLRTKAIGVMICIVFVYFIICRKRREFGFFSWLTMGMTIVILGARQFAFYFTVRGEKVARSVLMTVSLRIAKDQFPFGTGFATFGSAASSAVYSKVYYLYHIQNVWGLSRKFGSFISDTFWPMILGQTGWLGLLCYGIMLLLIASVIRSMGKVNAYDFGVALAIGAYLMITSTAEAAFVNPMATPFAFLFGIILVEYCRQVREKKAFLQNF